MLNLGNIDKTGLQRIVSSSKTKEALTLRPVKSMSPHMQKAFDILDSKANGTIGLRDVKVSLRALGIEPTTSKVAKLVEVSSVDKKCELSREEFENMFARVLNDIDSDGQMRRAYRMFDRESKGGITFQDLKKVAEELQLDIADEEIREMITFADGDGDEKVTLQEFITTARKIF